MKWKIFYLVILLSANVLNGQQRYRGRSYEQWGLPDSGEIGESLIIALPLLLIGFLIAYGFAWSKKETEVSNTSTSIGCIGMVIMAIGIFFLLPLLTWVEFIFMNILSIIVTIIVVGTIVYLIVTMIKKLK